MVHVVAKNNEGAISKYPMPICISILLILDHWDTLLYNQLPTQDDELSFVVAKLWLSTRIKKI